MANEFDGCIPYIIGGILILAVIIALLYIVTYIAMGFAFAGGVYGGVVSIGNYSKSFNENIGRKRIWKSNRQN